MNWTTADAQKWSVMLANVAPPTDDTLRDLANQGYTFDIKWDGVRALAVIDNGLLTLRNRKGEDFTFRYPELSNHVREHFAGKTCVLDGEVMIFDPQTGVPRFTLTSRRAFGPGRVADINRMAAALPATFVAFDCLAHDGGDMRGVEQEVRLMAMSNVLRGRTGPRFQESIRNHDGVALMQVVKAQNLEGLIAKRLKSAYRAGRRNDWLKIKPTHTITCITIPCPEPRTCDCSGKGWRADYFGALHIAVIGPDGSLIDVGKVGSGFAVADLTLLEPFVKADQELLIEVEYQERQPDSGVLRFPRYKGVRWDVDRSAASAEQFDRTPSA